MVKLEDRDYHCWQCVADNEGEAEADRLYADDPSRMHTCDPHLAEGVREYESDKRRDEWVEGLL